MALIRKLDCIRLYVTDLEAALLVEQAGGKVIVPPFEIRFGRCVLLDTSRGLLKTDTDEDVMGNLES